jgi:hypothetical protein
MVKLTYPYITIDIRGDIGDQLFQLAHTINFSHESKKAGVKRRLVFCDNTVSSANAKKYWGTIFKGLFRVLDREEYGKLNLYKIKSYEDDSNYYNNSVMDLELNDINCQTFNYIEDRLREKMIKIVYNNEDIMYPAYYKYRDVLDFFGKDTTDDDMVSLHITKGFDTTGEEYYKEALKISGKKNVAIFTDDIDWFEIREIVDRFNTDSLYNFYYVPKSDTSGDEIDFVLMSMFKNNIIANSTYSLWASYISYYDDKIIIAPQKLVNINKDIIHKYISHIV